LNQVCSKPLSSTSPFNASSLTLIPFIIRTSFGQPWIVPLSHLSFFIHLKPGRQNTLSWHKPFGARMQKIKCSKHKHQLLRQARGTWHQTSEQGWKQGQKQPLIPLQSRFNSPRPTIDVDHLVSNCSPTPREKTTQAERIPHFRPTTSPMGYASRAPKNAPAERIET